MLVKTSLHITYSFIFCCRRHCQIYHYYYHYHYYHRYHYYNHRYVLTMSAEVGDFKVFAGSRAWISVKFCVIQWTLGLVLTPCIRRTTTQYTLLHLRCGGILIFNDRFIARFLLSLTMKEFWKSVNIWRSYGQEHNVSFIWLTVYTHTYKQIH